MINNRHQPVRVFLFIGIPVAQSSTVIVTSFKPAIINNETLNAQSCCTLSHLHDVIRIVIEINTFPGIEMYGAFFLLRKTDDFIT